MTSKYWLIIITLLAFIVRIYQTNYVPLLWDEASIGYNAYSIIKTGKDEYGVRLPFIFKSFGDYKPGFYIYLTIPFVADLGLTPLAVRLPSIIIGSLTPLFLFLLITAISPGSKKLALISALLLAFNPFNILFSRGAWETNILTFELILASYFFVRQKYFWSSLVFGLTLFTYQGGKIMSPLIILALLIIFRPSLKNFFLKFSLPLFIIALPVIVGLLTQNDSNRLQVFSLWSYSQNQTEVNQIVAESSRSDYLVFHNQVFFFLRGFWERYFNNFSPRFLVFEGDWQVARHSTPYIGVILYPSLIFLYLGLFKKLSSRLTPLTCFFLFWLLTAPLASALTRDSIQPVRDMSLSIPLIFFIASGLKLITSSKLKIFIFFVYILSFIYYSDLYLNHFVKNKPPEHLYGYQQATNYLLANSKDKTDIYFSDFYGQPYIFYLFFSQYDPAKYQSQANLVVNGLDTGKVTQIDNIHFESPNFNGAKLKPHQLMIFSYDDAIRQGIDLSLLTPLSPVNNTTTFYGYQTN
ncbi:MAG: hypothetical protein WC596_03195 [Candidatus Shapirobacteria bacterium]